MILNEIQTNTIAIGVEQKKSQNSFAQFFLFYYIDSKYVVKYQKVMSSIHL